MGIGGIETYLYRTIIDLKKRGNRIIWIFPEGGYIDDSFIPYFMDGSIEIIRVNLDDFSWINRIEIEFGENETVFAFSTNLRDFLCIEMLKKKYQSTEIDTFYWVPHFCGKGIFVEEFLPKILQPFVKIFVQRILRKMEENNNIFYVNHSHLVALTERYKYEVADAQYKLIKGSNRDILPFDEDLARKRAKREPFNIITVSRFDFPHKAFVLGLIRTYAKLKTQYSNLCLTIIGYGPDETKVHEEIRRLPSNIQGDIHLLGKVPYANLKEYFEEAHLNIGLASTIADGALTGLISIPVRHYSETCEGYGYLPDSREFTTSSKPGIPIEKFIEEVLQMDENTYLDLSKASYDAYASCAEDNATDNLLLKTNKKPGITLPTHYILAFRVAYWLARKIKKIQALIAPRNRS